jgi:hypothetical protein
MCDPTPIMARPLTLRLLLAGDSGAYLTGEEEDGAATPSDGTCTPTLKLESGSGLSSSVSELDLRAECMGSGWLTASPADARGEEVILGSSGVQNTTDGASSSRQASEPLLTNAHRTSLTVCLHHTSPLSQLCSLKCGAMWWSIRCTSLQLKFS